MFNIDSSQLVKYTAKLEQVSRYALPVAVRGALNDTAFENKKDDIVDEFDDKFINRRKNFIKAHTGVEKIPFSSLDISTMAAKSGVIAGKSVAGDNLEKQEFGGVISERLIPTANARISKDLKKKQSSKYFARNFRKKGLHKKSKNIKILVTDNAVILFQKGKDSLVLHHKQSSVSLKKDPFIKPSGEKSAKNIGKHYINRARKKLKTL